MTPGEARALQTRLIEVFAIHGVDVGVGITKDGVAIRSQDAHVDAQNIGIINAWEDSVYG